MELVGSERLRAHSLTGESRDVLIPGTVGLTSILTCPQVGAVAPRLSTMQAESSIFKRYNSNKRKKPPDKYSRNI